MSRRLLVSGIAAIVLMAALAATTLDQDSRPALASPANACGAATAATIAAVDTAAAEKIYAGETHSRETSADVAHVTGAQALLSALASSKEAAAREAVHAIVYAPHWHIVRLRVVKAGRVLADVGGPDVIAPVGGPLRWHGRTVGSFVMSVQDDLGYVKLVSRFIGVPVDLYRNGSLVMGTLALAQPPARNGQRVSSGGAAYQTQLFDANAFPSGVLRVALLVPIPSGAEASPSCTSVRSAAWGSIATHIAARLTPLPAHYQDLVDVLRGTTGGVAVVKAGSQQLAGGPAPANVPRTGTVKFRGRSWSVFSWEPVPPARIYLLTPSG
jgi:hypothetical protein